MIEGGPRRIVMIDPAEPVYGFRLWRVGLIKDAGVAKLLPLMWFTRGAWVPGENTSDRPPTGPGEHGLYSYRRMPDLIDWLRLWCEETPFRAVAGITLNWGQATVGPDAFAAEHARVIAVLDGHLPPLTDPGPVARAYGVPVVPWDGAGAFAAEHGHPMAQERPMAPLVAVC